MEAISTKGRWINLGACTRSATAVAARDPTMSWPSAPMLNNPVRLAKAKARPVRMIGMALMTNSPMYRVFQGTSLIMSRPEKPLTIAANMATGDLPVAITINDPRMKPNRTARRGRSIFSLRLVMPALPSASFSENRTS